MLAGGVEQFGVRTLTGGLAEGLEGNRLRDGSVRLKPVSTVTISHALLEAKAPEQCVDLRQFGLDNGVAAHFGVVWNVRRVGSPGVVVLTE